MTKLSLDQQARRANRLSRVVQTLSGVGLLDPKTAHAAMKAVIAELHTGDAYLACEIRRCGGRATHLVTYKDEPARVCDRHAALHKEDR